MFRVLLLHAPGHSCDSAEHCTNGFKALSQTVACEIVARGGGGGGGGGPAENARRCWVAT